MQYCMKVDHNIYIIYEKYFYVLKITDMLTVRNVEDIFN
jgi:hypothetical protein